MKKLFCIVTVVAFFSVASLFPMRAEALVPPLLQFGGWPTATIPCTCSVATWSWFAPLYLSSVPVTGPLVYTPYSTLPFPYYLFTIPGVPHKGAYIPGVQACWMYAGITCVPLPSIGVMGFVGTGLAPAK